MLSLAERLEATWPLAPKIAIPLVAISVAAATLITTTMIVATRQTFATSDRAQTQALTQLVSSAYLKDPQDRASVSALLSDIWAAVPSVRRIHIYRVDGGAPVLWASTDLTEIGRYSPTPEEIAPITTGVPLQREDTYKGERIVERIEPVRVGTRTIVASVGVFISQQDRDEAIAAIERKIVLLAVAGVVAQLAVLWTILFWLVLRRAVRLSRVAAQVAEGNLTVQLPEGRKAGGDDELFQVAREFDHMVRAVGARTRQQASVTQLGQRALEEAEISTLMEEAAQLVAQNLEVEYVAILKHLPETDTFQTVAGVGWKEGVIGRLMVAECVGSLSRYTLASREPVIVTDVRTETRFGVPPSLKDHNILSSISVIIPSRDRPYGILSAHTTSLRIFSQDDVHFLQTIAHTLGWAVRRRLAEEQRGEARVLEMITRSEPLGNILNAITEMVEGQRPGALCAMLLAKKGCLYHVAGRTLPASYTRAIDGTPIDPNAGSAALAVHGRAPVIVGDIASDPSWKDREELALAHGLHASWAVPISSGDGQVLGSFVVYHREPKTPTPEDFRLIGAASGLASIAIEHRSLADRLAYQAHHDALTGLPNRVLFEDRFQQALAGAQANNHVVALLFADLDDFKRTNDTLGHHIGDILLQHVARRLQGRIRESDTLARMGGDEFAVILTGLKDPKDVEAMAQQLLDTFHAAFELDGYVLFVNVSIGISLYPQDGQEATVLKRKADAAMYRAKTRGTHNFQFFTPEMLSAAFERLELDNSLRRALDRGEFTLHYQPQFEIKSGNVVGFEALLRWNHPKLGMVAPARFIPLAEESGLIMPIGTWVLREACEQNAAWQRAGYKPVKVGVNVSALQFARTDFVQTVSHLLDGSGLNPKSLDLELTESVLMRDIEDVRQRLAELRALGVSISIDDFGTGYSSLSYLRGLPIDSLKIDRSFVRDITLPTAADQPARLVMAIVSLAHSLGLEVVAEGVETVSQLEFLRSVDCDRGQGFLVAEPLPADQLVPILESLRSGSGQKFAA